jgi:hypothetical protein
MIPDCGPLTEVVLIRYMCCCYYCIVYELQTPPDWKWPTQWRGWHLKQYPASNPAAVSDQSRLLALPLKQMASMVKMPGIARAWQDIWPTDYARNHTGSRSMHRNALCLAYYLIIMAEREHCFAGGSNQLHKAFIRVPRKKENRTLNTVSCHSRTLQYSRSDIPGDCC